MEQVAWIFNRKCMMNFLHDYAEKHLGMVAAVTWTSSVSFPHLSQSLSISILYFNLSSKLSPMMRTEDTCQHFRKCVTPHIRCVCVYTLQLPVIHFEGTTENLLEKKRAFREIWLKRGGKRSWKVTAATLLGMSNFLWQQTSYPKLSHLKIDPP